jgi:hypothetical protein
VIDLEVKDLGFTRALEAAIVNIPQEVSRKFHRWTLLVMRDLVMNTPQWSGDTAANWNYSVGMPDGSYTPIIAKALAWAPEPGMERSIEPRQRGDMAAVWAAMARAEDGPEPRYDQKVYLTNNTPIAPLLEAQQVPVRPVNLVNGAVAMAQYTAVKWRNMPFRM